MNKKGLSPIIATILLIAITIALFGTVFAFLRGNMLKQMQENDPELAGKCFDIGLEMQAKQVGSEIKVFVSNTGNVPIYELNVKVSGLGSSDTLVKQVIVDEKKVILEPSQGGYFIITAEEFANKEKIEITPVISGPLTTLTVKKYTCKENSQVLNIEE